MKYDKNLLKIVEDKNFKTFWHCLDYLLMAGYSAIDAFGISLKQFGESKIYSSVAFVRMEKWNKHIWLDVDSDPTKTKQPAFIIGLIDDSNIHLAGLYKVYRDMLIHSGGNYSEELDIEETCELIKTTLLTPFIINYLLVVSKKHFGIESFEIPKPLTPVTDGYALPNFDPIEPYDQVALIRKLRAATARVKRTEDPNSIHNGWPLPPRTHEETKVINLAKIMEEKQKRIDKGI